MPRALALAAAAVIAVALALAPTASASRFLRLGIFDDTQILYGNPDKVFPVLKSLRTQTIRVNLYWGGPNGVAKARPVRPTDPADSAYDWSTYDRTVRYANAYGMDVVFSIFGTPEWANGGRSPNVVPARAVDLKNFARAAARRYDGTYVGLDGRILPPVRRWLAWNEPNNPLFLSPQYVKKGGTWTVQSAKDYAKICNAIVEGIHLVKKNKGLVACGVTGPRGNNNPNSSRPSLSPLSFLRAMKKAGATGFDAYAHHPYYGQTDETPTTPPPQGPRGNPATAITLGNFSLLTREITRLYGNMRIWITEYGYQTNPPDKAFGVTYAQQAAYMQQAFDIARANPRIDMFLWFLLRDETVLGGWQSGLLTAGGKKKPSFTTFAQLR